MSGIAVRGLTYTYPGGSRPALQEISFQVERGQLLAVVGANGAGKSTLCLALSGLLSGLFQGELAGEVWVDGLDARRPAPGAFAGRVGLVLPNPASQFSGLAATVRAEVAFGLENLGVPRPVMLARIERALQQVGLAEFGERSPYALSGGQQQRLALAASLALEPPVLVLDEPTAMLDARGSQRVLDILRDLTRAGTTVVLAEHRLEWIAEQADQVLALAAGAVLRHGAPATVLAAPEMLSAGIGWLRYTQAAQLGRARGRWPAARPLPVTLAQARQGFVQGGGDADPG